MGKRWSSEADCGWRGTGGRGTAGPAAGGQPGKCVAQNGLLLGHEQFLLDGGGLGVRDAFGDQDPLASTPRVRGVDHASALAPRGGGQPARERSRFAQVVQMGHQLEPDDLADILGVGCVQPEVAADRPDQRGVPLDERVPRLLLAVLGACHQVGDWQIISHRVTVPSCRCPEAARVRAALVLHIPTMRAGR